MKVFGAYCDQNLGLRDKNIFFGGNSCFTFVLEPFEQKFEWTGLNSDHILCTKEFFSIGDGGLINQFN